MVVCMNTKDKIWNTALELFSKSGFEGVSVRDIASAVGVRESALYRHYKNKREIYDVILLQYSAHMNAFFAQMNLANQDGAFIDGQNAVAFFGTVTEQQLVDMGRQIFYFLFCDQISTKVRRMLTIEQYKNKAAAELYRKISFEDALSYQSGLFQDMINHGLFRPADPDIMALHFVAPMFLFFYKFDDDEQGLALAQEMIGEHIKQFGCIYAP